MVQRGEDQHGRALVVEDRGAEGVDPRQGASGRARDAMDGHFGAHGLQLPRREASSRGAGVRGRIAKGPRGLDQALGRQRGREGTAGGGFQQGHHAAHAQGDVQRLACLDQAHHRRPEVSPHREHHGVSRPGGKLLDHRLGLAHRVELVQAGQPDAQRRRPQPIARAELLLFDQAQARVADQVGVRARGAQTGARGQVLQRQGLGAVGQHQQQAASHFDGLDRALCLVALLHLRVSQGRMG